MSIYRKYESSFRFSTFWTIFFMAVLAVLVSNNTRVLNTYTSTEHESIYYNFFYPHHIWNFIIDQKKFDSDNYINDIELKDGDIGTSKYAVIVDFSKSLSGRDNDIFTKESRKLFVKDLSENLRINIPKFDEYSNCQLVGLSIGTSLEKSGISSSDIYPFYYVDNEEQNLCFFENKHKFWYDKILNTRSFEEDDEVRTYFPKLIDEIISRMEIDEIDEVILVSDFKHKKNQISETSVDLVKELNEIRGLTNDTLNFKLIKIPTNYSRDHIDYSNIIKQVFNTEVHAMNNQEFESFFQSNSLDEWLRGFTNKEINNVYGTFKLVNVSNLKSEMQNSVTIRPKRYGNKILLYPKDNISIGLSRDSFRNKNLATPNNSIHKLDSNTIYSIRINGLLSKPVSYYFEIMNSNKKLKEKFRIIYCPHLSKNVIQLWTFCLLGFFTSIAIPVVLIFKEILLFFRTEITLIFYILALLLVSIIFNWPWVEYLLSVESFSFIGIIVTALFM